MSLIESIVVRYIRFDGCNVFISALELFNFFFFFFTLLSLYFTFNPQGSCACIWLGSTFPFFPLGFWVFVPGGAQACSPSSVSVLCV